MNNLITVVLLCIALNETVSGRKEGDACIDNGNKIGECKRMVDCATAQENLNKTIFPKICSFNRLVVIVCCSDLPPNVTVPGNITKSRISINNDAVAASPRKNSGEISRAIEGVELQFINKEDDTIWIGINSLEGEHLKNGGFVLSGKTIMSIGVPKNWSGRIWGRTYCDVNTQKCLTGDCGKGLECQGNSGVPPVSMVEIALKSFSELDFYDVSLVDGFNVPVTIEPVDGKNDSKVSCKKVGCPLPLNDYCPDRLKVNSNLGVIACNSACSAFKTDFHCRGNAYRSPQRWLVKYSTYFKFNCPDVYSFPYDDRTTHTCRAKKYKIVFGT